jgi:flagellar protein FlbD
MIVLTRLNGTRFAINDEQIERLEEGPNTVVVLVNGNRYTSLESLDEVVDAIVLFRARVLEAGSIMDPALHPHSAIKANARIAMFRPHSVLSDDMKAVEIEDEPLIDKRRPKLRDVIRRNDGEPNQ